MTRQKILQFDWEVLIHSVYSPATLDVYLFQFYKILLIEKKKINSLEDGKGIKNSSLFKKMKSLGRQNYFCFSVTQSCLTLQPHGLQHTRLPCPSPSPRTCSSSYPLSQWCRPTSSSVIPFSCLQSFPASGSLLLNWLFVSSGQIIGDSASASVLPINIQDWFPSGLTGLISLLSKTLKNLLQHCNSKPSIHRQSPFFNPLQCSCLENPRDRGGWWVAIYEVAQSQTWLKQLSSSSSILLYGPTLTSTHGHWKSHKFDYTDLCWQVMSLPFNTPSGFVIAFLLRSKCLLASWLQSSSEVILELRS